MTNAALRLEDCLSRRGIFRVRRQRDSDGGAKGGCGQPGLEMCVGHLVSLLIPDAHMLFTSTACRTAARVRGERVGDSRRLNGCR
jgi:hypothetical protein